MSWPVDNRGEIQIQAFRLVLVPLSAGLRGPFLSGAVILWTGNGRSAQESPATFSLLFSAQPFPKCLVHTQCGTQWISVELRARALSAPASSPHGNPRHSRSSPHPPLLALPGYLPAPRSPATTHAVWVTVLNAFFMVLKCTHRASKGRRTKLLSQGRLFSSICLHDVPQSLCKAASPTQPCLSLCLLEWGPVPALRGAPSCGVPRSAGCPIALLCHSY